MSDVTNDISKLMAGVLVISLYYAVSEYGLLGFGVWALTTATLIASPFALLPLYYGIQSKLREIKYRKKIKLISEDAK